MESRVIFYRHMAEKHSHRIKLRFQFLKHILSVTKKDCHNLKPRFQFFFFFFIGKISIIET